MRIYGLSGSGMDVDSMVKDLMKAANAPLDKLKQQKTVLQWKKDDYTSMYKSISEFRTKVFDCKLQKTVSPQRAASSSESVATATTAGGAPTVAHELTVTTLASGVNTSSTAKADVVVAGDGSVDRSSLAAQFGVDTAFSGSVQLNGKTVAISGSDTIYEVVSNINKAGAGVQASYDSTLDRMFLSTSTTGASTKIDFTGSDQAALGFLYDELKLTNAVDKAAGPVYTAKATLVGADAAFELDGEALTQSSNTFAIAGVSYTLKGAGTTTVSVTTDVDQAVDNVKAFIESYNSLLQTVNDKVAESYDKDYTPLTDDQKEEMSDDEIKSWETIAKTGLLRNDPALKSLTTAMRNAIADPVSGLSGSYTSLSSIGITSGSYTENGKLYLDETKLRQALQADPDALKNVFATDGDTAAEDGAMVRLYDSLKTAMDKINSSAGVLAGSGDTNSSMAKQLKSLNTRIDDTGDRLTAMQERYYKQFDAMETMLQKLTNQSSWLSQQLGTSG